MERRDFLKASCYTGLASLTAGASTALGQSDNPPRRLPNETQAAYAARLARWRAQMAAEGQMPPRMAGESAAAYRARVARMRAQAAAAARDDAQGELPAQLEGETDAAYQARLARLRAARATQTRQQIGPFYFYELRRYAIETQAQKAGFDTFGAEALIPALNRADVGPVGVFYPAEDLSPIYVLLCHRSMASFVGLTATLMQDKEFLAKGAAFLQPPVDKPAYQRLSVQLMRAFAGMPKLETPIDSSGRVLQLRTYESPSVQTGLKKIEMFNTAEIEIFRKTGLHPVFFGQTLAGEKMPNLTYMLVFEDMAESKANWSRFGRDPDWQALRAKPEYADDKILCGITNLYLKPASYSQI